MQRLLVAAAVAVSGVIGFIGLVVPHLMRMWLGADHRAVVPGSVLAGALLLLVADTLARTGLSGGDARRVIDQPSRRAVVPVAYLSSRRYAWLNAIVQKIFFHAGQRTLIDDVSLTLSQGELVALIGPNGAGKSTLLRLLTGYLKPASGRCTLAGTPLADWLPDTLARYRAVMRQNTQPGFDWPVDAVVGMGRAPGLAP